MVTFGIRRAALGAALACAASCGSDSKTDESDSERAAVTAQYATLVEANYADVLSKTKALQAAVDAFVKAPTAASQKAAQDAWLAAREPYGQSEVFRFYDGPIDSPENDFEGQINGWPLSESHIDAVEGDDDAGIINKPDMFPTLTKQLLIEQNGCCGMDEVSETNIATGYHAIEFLLWGQDLSDTGPGARPHTDFLTGEGATRPHGDRRGQYLSLAAELLVDQLTAVHDEWVEGEQNYRATWVAQSPNVALENMLKGMTKLAGFELSGERMTTAWMNEDQEDEHSCFSDNTHRDIYLNAKGVENVYRGTYGSVSGPSLRDLVVAADATLAGEIDQGFSDVFSAIGKIPVPFDAALRDAEKKPAIKAAIDALRALHVKLLSITPLLGLKATDEPL